MVLPKITKGDTSVNYATIARQFIQAFERNQHSIFDELCSPEITTYTPLVWESKGLDRFKAYVQEFHKAFPGFRTTIHDLISSNDKVVIRVTISFTNSGSFFNYPPTGKSGESMETYTCQFVDGQIVEMYVADNTFDMAALFVRDWNHDFPRNIKEQGI